MKPLDLVQNYNSKSKSPNAPLAQRVTKFREIYMNAFISLNPIEI